MSDFNILDSVAEYFPIWITDPVLKDVKFVPFGF